MILAQQMGSQKLERREEPQSLTNDQDNVNQYDRVMTTKLVIAYALGMEAVHRARTETIGERSKAIDLACGPGHYTLCIRKYLGYSDVIGIDLAPNMVEIASAKSPDRNHVRFQLGDVTSLPQLQDNTFDLASFTDAAHHMRDLLTVGRILMEMDRVTRPEGLVMLMDLARLRTAELTETYVNFLGGDYVAKGLPNFFDDFRNSMYAAWTYTELKTAIPKNSRRVWCQLVSKILPTLQIVIGLPVGRKTLFVRRGLPWQPRDHPIPDDLRMEWRFARTTLFSASPCIIPD
jgi:ubiquinone/menaquinone biosynthesis C-methylase UbiE